MTKRAAPTAPDHDDLPLITERELAHRWGIARKTLQNARVSGGGVPFLKIGSCVRYRLADVLEYEERRRFSSTSQKEQGKPK